VLTAPPALVSIWFDFHEDDAVVALVAVAAM
jgi:hypothetical protein